MRGSDSGGRGSRRRLVGGIMLAGLLLASMVGAAVSIADGPGTEQGLPAAGDSERQVTGQPDTGSSTTVPGVGPPTDLTGVGPVGPDDKHPKLESPLATVARIAREQGVEAAVAEAQARGLHTVGDQVRVVVVGADDDAGAARTVAASLGGMVESFYESLSQVLISVASLERLAAAPEVQSIRAPIVARPADESQRAASNPARAIPARTLPFTSLVQGDSYVARVESTTLIVTCDPADAPGIAAMLQPSAGAARVGEVDFDVSCLVLLVRGQRPSGGYRITVEALAVDAGTVRLTASLGDPDPGRIVPEVLTYPYHLVTVSRADLPSQPGTTWVVATLDGQTLTEIRHP